MDRVQPLKIGIIAPPWVTVPPTVYGGTEVVVDVLARGLMADGHNVQLFTTGDSTCPVPRDWHYPQALGTVAPAEMELAHVKAAYASLGDVDVVHDHTMLGPEWAPRWRPDLPIVTTNHGPFTQDAIEHYRALDRRVAIVAISGAQRRTAPSVPVAAVIHHGIELERFPMGSGGGDYLLFLGRMSADKGVHRAIAVAQMAGCRLLIAAKMWEPAERRYFAEVVEPLLGDDAVYLGHVGGQEKLELLAEATALVNPIRWPEPFGLVMIEALACGTPVLAYPEGAAPEIIEPGRTGFLCDDEADMAAKVGDVAALDREACRASVAGRFSARRFVDDHVALYNRVLGLRGQLVA